MTDSPSGANTSDSMQQLLDANIMLVDDEPTTMMVVRSFLEEDGYHNFTLIDDSSRALNVLDEQRPDLVMLDLMMPEVSGMDILKAMRRSQKFQHLPVIILTSSEATEDKLSCLELGATDFLAKPVDPSELRLRVRNTLAAKAYQDQLAYYDRHTNLPNRHTFFEHLDHTLEWSRQDGNRFAILSIELDQFDTISDTVGLSAGDAVLTEVARRLQTVIRNKDSLARFDPEHVYDIYLSRFEGSIFSMLLHRIPGEESAAFMARHILRVIEEPVIVENQEIYLTASIGIEMVPSGSTGSVELMRSATSARNYVKSHGGNGFQFSSQQIDQQYRERLKLEAGLRKAIERNELFLLYQPRVDIHSGTVVGAEALLRWKRADGQIIPPNDFIPLAEETELIIPIGAWVLKEACAQLAIWHEKDNMPICVSVNLSTIQFMDPQLPAVVKGIIEESGIDPRFLTLELTESIMMSDVDEKIDIMRQLKSMGLKLSIDDFGTGYSSFNYLRKLPLDELKIDKSFVDPLLNEPNSQALVSSVIYLGQKLGLVTVAEGVEGSEHLDFLRRQHCDLYQGAIFSMPVSNIELQQLFHGAN